VKPAFDALGKVLSVKAVTAQMTTSALNTFVRGIAPLIILPPDATRDHGFELIPLVPRAFTFLPANPNADLGKLASWHTVGRWRWFFIIKNAMLGLHHDVIANMFLVRSDTLIKGFLQQAYDEYNRKYPFGPPEPRKSMSYYYRLTCLTTRPEYTVDHPGMLVILRGALNHILPNDSAKAGRQLNKFLAGMDIYESDIGSTIDEARALHLLHETMAPLFNNVAEVRLSIIFLGYLLTFNTTYYYRIPSPSPNISAVVCSLIPNGLFLSNSKDTVTWTTCSRIGLI
jgi:hypothetical protein